MVDPVPGMIEASSSNYCLASAWWYGAIDHHALWPQYRRIGDGTVAGSRGMHLSLNSRPMPDWHFAGIRRGSSPGSYMPAHDASADFLAASAPPCSANSTRTALQAGRHHRYAVDLDVAGSIAVGSGVVVLDSGERRDGQARYRSGAGCLAAGDGGVLMHTGRSFTVSLILANSAA